MQKLAANTQVVGEGNLVSGNSPLGVNVHENSNKETLDGEKKPCAKRPLKILVVTHNVPYPPNKGDKIRSWNLIKELAKNNELHLVSLVRDKEDQKYQDKLSETCQCAILVQINPLRAKLRAALALFSKKSLTEAFFKNKEATLAVENLCRRHDFDAKLAICSSVGSYVLKSSKVDGKDREVLRAIDFVDVDSAKWKRYSLVSKPPRSWLYWSEFKRLARLERELYKNFEISVLTTSREKQVLAAICSDDSEKTLVCPNGIDTSFFKPLKEMPADYKQLDGFGGKDSKAIVFVGQMDYLPNVDAAIYFYRLVLPELKRKHKNLQFLIVGRKPVPKLSEVCKTAIITGEVDDVRPWIHAASVFVAPMRLAFGVQNKVLEAMACKIPVVSSERILNGMTAEPGRDLLLANSPSQFQKQVDYLLSDEELRQKVAEAGYRYVLKNHDWSSSARILETAIRAQTSL